MNSYMCSMNCNKTCKFYNSYANRCTLDSNSYHQGQEDAVNEFIKKFNQETICLGRSGNKEFILKVMNEIGNEIKGSINEKCK